MPVCLKFTFFFPLTVLLEVVKEHQNILHNYLKKLHIVALFCFFNSEGAYVVLHLPIIVI